MSPGTPKVTQNGPKMEPKWSQNGSQMEPKWYQNEARMVFRSFQGPTYLQIPKKWSKINKNSKKTAKIKQKLKKINLLHVFLNFDFLLILVPT